MRSLNWFLPFLSVFDSSRMVKIYLALGTLCWYHIHHRLSRGGWSTTRFLCLRSEETFDTVFDRFLLFLEKFFIAVKCEVLEKFPTRVDTPLPALWYNHLLRDGDQTRWRIYKEVITTTEASHDSMSMVSMKWIVAKNSIKAERTPHYPTSGTEDQRPGISQ